MNPKSGSRIAAARDYGIDLHALVEQLRKSPAERAEVAQRRSEAMASIRDNSTA